MTARPECNRHQEGQRHDHVAQHFDLDGFADVDRQFRYAQHVGVAADVTVAVCAACVAATAPIAFIG